MADNKKRTSKVKTKKTSTQVEFKLQTMDIVRNLLESQGLKVIDCRIEKNRIEGSTRFTLFVRSQNADLKISFISKPDKKSPYYVEVDEVLGEDLCDDEE